MNHETIYLISNKNPVLTSFEYSFDFVNLIEERKSILYNHKNKIQPIEINILLYLDNSSNNLSLMNIETIIDEYIQTSLDILDKTTKKEWREKAVFSLTSYINKSKQYVIHDIIEKYSLTWNNYCLSLFFLHLLNEINTINEKYIKNEFFINEFFNLILPNIDPDISKRNTIEKCDELFNHLIKNTDFSYLR